MVLAVSKTEQTRAPVPILPTLYVGIDIGHKGHYTACVSANLLRKHKTYEKCPTRYIKNNRADFELLAADITAVLPMSRVHILLENTGHYGSGLIQFLQEHGAHLYRMHPQKRYNAMLKTDKADSLFLAANLYNQIALHVPVTDKALRVYPLLPGNETVVQLRGLVQHRSELSNELVRRQNKLYAICDELFPEFMQIYDDPNSESALNLRERYPTPEAIACASLDELAATRVYRFPGRVQLARLQTLARETIGTKDEHRRSSLLIEQQFLIRQKRALDHDLTELDKLIEPIVANSREGKILLSFAGIGPTSAALLIAGIGNIANYANAYHLRSYLGWSPKQSQTGSTYDHTSLAKGGNRLLKRTLYLIAMNAIKVEPWKSIYKTLCARMAIYNPKTKKWRGRRKALGHICGKMIKLMYALLKKDYILVSEWQGRIEDLPQPECYDAERHMNVSAGGKHHTHPTLVK